MQLPNTHGVLLVLNTQHAAHVNRVLLTKLHSMQEVCCCSWVSGRCILLILLEQQALAELHSQIGSLSCLLSLHGDS